MLGTVVGPAEWGCLEFGVDGVQRRMIARQAKVTERVLLAMLMQCHGDLARLQDLAAVADRD